MTALTHLQRLEAESIHIMREVVSEVEKPVMLYSIGKDSSVMLHLARKAFYPAVPPFPLLHVDTTWKFRDMYAMRTRMADERHQVRRDAELVHRHEGDERCEEQRRHDDQAGVPASRPTTKRSSSRNGRPSSAPCCWC